MQNNWSLGMTPENYLTNNNERSVHYLAILKITVGIVMIWFKKRYKVQE